MTHYCGTGFSMVSIKAKTKVLGLVPPNSTDSAKCKGVPSSSGIPLGGFWTHCDNKVSSGAPPAFC